MRPFHGPIWYLYRLRSRRNTFRVSASGMGWLPHGSHPENSLALMPFQMVDKGGAVAPRSLLMASPTARLG